MALTSEERCFNQLTRHLEKGRLDLFERSLARAHHQGLRPVWENMAPWSGLPLDTVTALRQQRHILWKTAAASPKETLVADLVANHPCLDLEAEHWGEEMQNSLRQRPLAVADWLMSRPGVKEKLNRQDNPLHALLGAACERRDTDAVRWLWRQEGVSPPQDTPAYPVLLEVSRMTCLRPQLFDLLSFLIQEKHVKPVPATRGAFNHHTPLTQLTTFYMAWQNDRNYPPAAKAAHDAVMIQVWPLLVNAGDDPARALKDLPKGARHALAPYPAGQADVIMNRLATLVPPPERPRRSRLRS